MDPLNINYLKILPIELVWEIACYLPPKEANRFVRYWQKDQKSIDHSKKQKVFGEFKNLYQNEHFWSNWGKAQPDSEVVELWLLASRKRMSFVTKGLLAADNKRLLKIHRYGTELIEILKNGKIPNFFAHDFAIFSKNYLGKLKQCPELIRFVDTTDGNSILHAVLLNPTCTPEIVGFLLDNKANPNITRNDGLTPLDLAIKPALIIGGQNVRNIDSVINGETLDASSRLSKLLLRHNANPTIGKYTLYVALDAGTPYVLYDSILPFMLQAALNTAPTINVTDQYFEKFFKALNYLVVQKIIDTENTFNTIAKKTSFTLTDPQELLQKQFQFPSTSGYVCMIDFAVQIGNAAFVIKLLELGGKPTKESMILAAYDEDPTKQTLLVKLLIEKGGDYTATDKNNASLLDIVQSNTELKLYIQRLQTKNLIIKIAPYVFGILATFFLARYVLKRYAFTGCILHETRE